MRRLLVVILGSLLLLLQGCSVLQPAKLLWPEAAGLEQADTNLYVEATADAATRDELRKAMVRAREAIAAAYGDVAASPVVAACVTESCYQSFGGRGASRAKAYGTHLLLSPRGLNWHYLAHEWSHAEMSTRLSAMAWWRRLPQWFDEGLAVAISAAPQNSEEHWQFLVNANVSRPTPEELRTFETLRQWDAAVGRYGEKQNLERKARGEPEIRPVYTAAGHEVRPWLAKAGTRGLRLLIEELNRGTAFDSAYSQAVQSAE